MAASNLGLLSLAPSMTSTQNTALKENILYSATGEIETTAHLLSQVKALQEHVNPPYIRGNYLLRPRLEMSNNRSAGFGVLFAFCDTKRVFYSSFALLPRRM